MKKVLAVVIAIMFAFSMTAFAADKAADTKTAPAKDEQKMAPKKAAKKAAPKTITGEVKAVDAKANTITVKSTKQEKTITADEQMLKDIKAGDRVVVKYTEKDGKLTASSVKPAKAPKSAKKAEKKDEKKAEPAAKPAPDSKPAKKKKGVEGC